MKLDRNRNPDGVGKYALLRLRELDAIREQGQSQSGIDYAEVLGAIDTLKRAGMIHWGDEDGGGEQFFVVKYKDKFAWQALLGYERAILDEITILNARISVDPRKHLIDLRNSLLEYAQEIRAEKLEAYQAGDRIPN